MTTILKRLNRTSSKPKSGEISRFYWLYEKSSVEFAYIRAHYIFYNFDNVVFINVEDLFKSLGLRRPYYNSNKKTVKNRPVKTLCELDAEHCFERDQYNCVSPLTLFAALEDWLGLLFDVIWENTVYDTVFQSLVEKFRNEVLPGLYDQSLFCPRLMNLLYDDLNHSEFHVNTLHLRGTKRRVNYDKAIENLVCKIAKLEKSQQIQEFTNQSLCKLVDRLPIVSCAPPPPPPSSSLSLSTLRQQQEVQNDSTVGVVGYTMKKLCVFKFTGSTVYFYTATLAHSKYLSDIKDKYDLIWSYDTDTPDLLMNSFKAGCFVNEAGDLELIDRAHACFLVGLSFSNRLLDFYDETQLREFYAIYQDCKAASISKRDLLECSPLMRLLCLLNFESEDEFLNDCFKVQGDKARDQIIRDNFQHFIEVNRSLSIRKLQCLLFPVIDANTTTTTTTTNTTTTNNESFMDKDNATASNSIVPERATADDGLSSERLRELNARFTHSYQTTNKLLKSSCSSESSVASVSSYGDTNWTCECPDDSTSCNSSW